MTPSTIARAITPVPEDALRAPVCRCIYVCLWFIVYTDNIAHSASQTPQCASEQMIAMVYADMLFCHLHASLRPPTADSLPYTCSVVLCVVVRRCDYKQVVIKPL